ncbi:unnamed protein product [Lampetra planeri]
MELLNRIARSPRLTCPRVRVVLLRDPRARLVPRCPERRSQSTRRTAEQVARNAPDLARSRSVKRRRKPGDCWDGRQVQAQALWASAGPRS